MRRLLLGAIAALALLAGLPNDANAWTQILSYTPSGGAIASPSAGGQLGSSGCYDQAGGIWSQNASNQIVASGSFSGSGYAQYNLICGTGAGFTQGRLIIEFVAVSGEGDTFGYVSAASYGSGITGYTAGLSTAGAINSYTVNGGGAGSMSTGGSYSSGYALTAGNSYRLILDRTGSSPTSLTTQLTDLTGTVLISPHAASDSTSALQGTAGLPGIFLGSSGTSPLITKIVTCSGTSSDGGAGCGVSSNATHVTVSPTSATILASGTQAFTYNLDGPVPSGDTVTVTPSTTIGTLSPTSLSFTTNTAQTVTLTAPGTAGTGALTSTHTVSGGTTLTLADPASSPITVNASSNIAVNSAAIHFSPGNWHGDTGRGGSVYREAWTSGAYFQAKWTAASSSPTAVLQFPSNSSAAQLFCYLNNVLTDGISTNGNYTLTGLTAGAVENLLCFTKRSTSNVARWNSPSGAVLKITGIVLDSGSTPGTVTVPSANNWVVMNSDSICEGDFANAGTNDFSRSACFFIEQNLMSLGYDVSMQAASGTGFLIPTDVPALYYVSGGTYSASSSRWNLQDNGVSLLDSASQLSSYGSTGTTPAAYLLWYGGNDCENNTVTDSDISASVAGGLGALRGAAPAMKIVFIPDFPILSGTIATRGTNCLAALNAGVTSYLSSHSSDPLFSESQPVDISNRIYGDPSRFVAPSNTVHPSESGNAISVPYLQQPLYSAMFPPGGGGTTTVYVAGPVRLPL